MPVKKYRPTSAGRRFITRKIYRIIDFKRSKDAIPAKVATIEYDPNRSARIALLHYKDGEKRYILAPVDLKVGDVIESGPAADIKIGNCLPIKNIPVGTVIHNIEHENQVIGKAGRMRHMGKRPSVRGIAMNPVDHPHGGGEARSTSGRPPTTPWGQMTMGKKTRRNKRTGNMIVRKRKA